MALGEEDPNQFGQTIRYSGRPWWLASVGVFLIALLATAPTTGDIGLTWDEPAYRYSQMVSAQWWEQLGRCHFWADVQELLDRDVLVYYWPYGRNGSNLHPPLAGQLSLVTHAVVARWLKDIPSRRLASVGEFCITLTILFGFLARRYGAWVGGVAAGALLLMPRVYGDAHIAGTDMPGLMLWAATAVAFWNALDAPHGTRWRVLFGVLLGLAFVEKMAAVAVILPTFFWLLVGHVPCTLRRRGGMAAWADGVLTALTLLVPLIVACLEIHRLARLLPPPGKTDLFLHRPPASWPGAILACPLAIWIVRRLLAQAWRGHPVWGVERPALETWTAALAFAPIVAWLGNPLWWRETLSRLAHYLMINTGRRGVLPDIPILYLGQTYLFSLPWHNAWVLMAVTVPAGIFVATLIGLAYVFRVVGQDRLPLYFLVHLITLPVVRMLGTPAHDGVRLFLPTFFFLAAMAGWGTIWVADGLSRLTRRKKTYAFRLGLTALVLGTAAAQLIRIHPYELSYYNELIGGPREAWRNGFELAYWYDAFNDGTIAKINQRLPPDATVDFLNPMAMPETFADLQALGVLRADIRLGPRDSPAFPYVWLLTQGSTATAFTRLLYVMKPWYESRPKQLDGLRVASVADPVAVSRAWALQLLVDAPSGGELEPPAAPAWIRSNAPPLAWFWDDGAPKAGRLNIDNRALEWAQRDPDGLRSAARSITRRQNPLGDKARRLMAILKRHDPLDPPGQLASQKLLRERPEALLEAVEILISRPNDVRKVLTRYPYTDDKAIGGFLDEGFR